MSFWGKLFGTDKALTSVVDGVKNGLDALVYTDEEKANDAAKDRSEARKMIIEWMASTQGQNLSRRLLSLSVTAVWLSQYILSQTMQLVAIWVDEPDKWRESAALLLNGAGSMDTAVMMILAFYFAAPHMGDIVQSILGKWSKGGLTKG